MGQQEQAAPAANEQQAVASLQAFFHQQVSEAMPKAIRASLADAQALGHWLHMASLHIRAGLFGPLDAADVRMLPSLSSSTLLVMLFDQRQPAEVTVAARDALLGRYLSDEDVQALAIATANTMARQAVQALVQNRSAQQLQQAETQSLYGHEHDVPGVPTLDMAAVTAQAQTELAQAAQAERV